MGYKEASVKATDEQIVRRLAKKFPDVKIQEAYNTGTYSAEQIYGRLVAKGLIESEQQPVQATQAVETNTTTPTPETQAQQPSQTSEEAISVSKPSNQFDSEEERQLYALMMTESLGKVDAVSETGVKGAFQVTRATARGLGFDPDSADYSDKAAASKLWADLMTKYGNSGAKAYGAYNAGEASVDKAIRLANEKGGEWTDHLNVPENTAFQTMTKRAGVEPDAKLKEVVGGIDRLKKHYSSTTLTQQPQETPIQPDTPQVGSTGLPVSQEFMDKEAGTNPILDVLNRWESGLSMKAGQAVRGYGEHLVGWTDDIAKGKELEDARVDELKAIPRERKALYMQHMMDKFTDKEKQQIELYQAWADKNPEVANIKAQGESLVRSGNEIVSKEIDEIVSLFRTNAANAKDNFITRGWTSGDLSDATAQLIAAQIAVGDYESANKLSKLRDTLQQDLATPADQGKMLSFFEGLTRLVPFMGKRGLLSAIPVVGGTAAFGASAAQGAGDIYADLKGAGASNEMARSLAAYGGVGYGLIEKLQIGELFKLSGGDKAVKQAFLKSLINQVKKRGISTLKEAGEEGLQAIITESAVEAGKMIEGLDEATIKERVGKVGKQALLESWEAVKTFGALEGLKAPVGMAVESRAAKKQALTEAQQADEADATIPEASELITQQIDETAPDVAYQEDAEEAPVAQDLVDVGYDSAQKAAYDVLDEATTEDQEGALAYLKGELTPESFAQVEALVKSETTQTTDEVVTDAVPPTTDVTQGVELETPAEIVAGGAQSRAEFDNAETSADLKVQDDATSTLRKEPVLAEAVQSEEIADILHPDVAIRSTLDKVSGQLDVNEKERLDQVHSSMRDANFNALGRKDIDIMLPKLIEAVKDGRITNLAKGEIDIGNLGYINTALGHEKANVVLKRIMDAIRKQAQPFMGADADMEFAKEGGDEIGIVGVNLSGADIESALELASPEIESIIDEFNMRDFIHPKHSNLKTGAGYINFGAVDYNELNNNKELFADMLTEGGEIDAPALFKAADRITYEQSKEKITGLIRESNDKKENFVYDNKDKHATSLSALQDEAEALGLIDTDKMPINESKSIILENIDKLGGGRYERYGKNAEAGTVGQTEQAVSATDTGAAEQEATTTEEVEAEPTRKRTKGSVDYESAVGSKWTTDTIERDGVLYSRKTNNIFYPVGEVTEEGVKLYSRKGGQYSESVKVAKELGVLPLALVKEGEVQKLNTLRTALTEGKQIGELTTEETERSTKASDAKKAFIEKVNSEVYSLVEFKEELAKFKEENDITAKEWGTVAKPSESGKIRSNADFILENDVVIPNPIKRKSQDVAFSEDYKKNQIGLGAAGTDEQGVYDGTTEDDTIEIGEYTEEDLEISKDDKLGELHADGIERATKIAQSMIKAKSKEAKGKLNAEMNLVLKKLAKDEGKGADAITEYKDEIKTNIKAKVAEKKAELTNKETKEERLARTKKERKEAQEKRKAELEATMKKEEKATGEKRNTITFKARSKTGKIATTTSLDINKVVASLQDIFPLTRNVGVLIENLPDGDAAQVEYIGKQALVTIDPRLSDTRAITAVMHELVGHYGIDQMIAQDGGMSAKVDELYESVKGTDYENKIKELYPEANPEILKKEVIASLIGDAANVALNADGSKKDSFIALDNTNPLVKAYQLIKQFFHRLLSRFTNLDAKQRDMAINEILVRMREIHTPVALDDDLFMSKDEDAKPAPKKEEAPKPKKRKLSLAQADSKLTHEGLDAGKIALKTFVKERVKSLSAKYNLLKEIDAIETAEDYSKLREQLDGKIASADLKGYKIINKQSARVMKQYKVVDTEFIANTQKIEEGLGNPEEIETWTRENKIKSHMVKVAGDAIVNGRKVELKEIAKEAKELLSKSSRYEKLLAQDSTKDTNFIRKIIDLGKFVGESRFASVPYLIDYMTRGADSSILHQVFVNNFIEGANREAELNNKATDYYAQMLQDAGLLGEVKNLFGKRSKKGALKASKSLQGGMVDRVVNKALGAGVTTEKIKVQRVKRDGSSKQVEIPLTSGQKISLSLYARNKNRRAQMTVGGIKYKRGAHEKFIFTDETLDTLTNNLTKAEKIVADRMYTWFNDKQFVQGELNSTSKSFSGIEIFNTEDYFPAQSEATKVDLKDVSGANNMSMMQSWLIESQPQNAAMTKDITATANNPIILQDAFEVFNDHSNAASKYVGYAIPMDTANKLHNAIGDGNKNGFESYGFKSADNLIDRAVKSIGGVSVDSMGSKLLSRVRGGIAINALGANIPVIFKQVPSVMLSWDSLSKRGIAATIAKVPGVGTNKLLEEIYDANPFIRQRYNNMGTTYYGETGSMAGARHRAIGQTGIGELSMAGISAADKEAITRIWKGVKQTAKDKGLTGKAYDKFTQENFANIIIKTQPDSNAFSKTGLQLSKNDLVRSAAMFSTQRAKLAQMMVMSSARVVWGTQDIVAGLKSGDKALQKQGLDSAKRGISQLLVQQLAQVALISSVDALTSVLKGKEDEDERSAWSIIGRMMLKNVIGQWIFIGNALDVVIAQLDKQFNEGKMGYEHYESGVGGLKEIQDAGKLSLRLAIANERKKKMNYKERKAFDEQTQRMLARTAGVSMKIPASGVISTTKLIQGANKLMNE